MINNIEYKVCINELNYRNIENLIVEYIQIQTSLKFMKIIYLMYTIQELIVYMKTLKKLKKMDSQKVEV